MIYLGDSYLYRQGTIVDYGQAALYYHEAEKTNQIEAILKLADFYKAVREFSLYKHYLQKARLQGSDKATLLLAKLYVIILKEKYYVKELLTELLASSTPTMDIIFEAEQMYTQLSLIKLTKK
ncbi:hypothetical protein DM558_12370 [Entomomonas moraniae]|uniref:Sel1 repeat family protein n=1 Tax=Entomomonas moraniae TaxID=2213226 RepID=A0A3Q9JMG1_9GAMM|nr:hypothetical protein [Entomomonas moraniae]AZS51514.1 hypothetical protein DM558_12370 [Entomomonas moraniae]